MKTTEALISSRRLLAVAGAALAGGFGLAAPAAAHVSAQPVGAGTLTTGRLVGTVAALVALAGVVIGGRALTRSAGNGKGGVIAGRALTRSAGNGKRGAIAGLAAGLAGMAVGALVVALAKGGPGTGYGIVGGYAALAIGLIATALGWLALARTRRPT